MRMASMSSIYRFRIMVIQGRPNQLTIFTLAAAVADGNEATCTPKIAPLGCTVLIGHPGGYISRYAHLRDLSRIQDKWDEKPQEHR